MSAYAFVNARIAPSWTDSVFSEALIGNQCPLLGHSLTLAYVIDLAE